MTPTHHDLIRRLATALRAQFDRSPACVDLLAEADAALAQPEADSSADEVDSLARELRQIAGCCDISNGLESAVPALTRAAELLGTSASKPVGTTANGDHSEDWNIRSESGSLCFASAIYARLVGGEQDESELLWLAEYLRMNSAITPIPVSERLPQSEDCDGEGRCWVHQPCAASPEAPSWMLLLRKYASTNYGTTCWLPHWALPLSAAQQKGQA